MNKYLKTYIESLSKLAAPDTSTQIDERMMSLSSQKAPVKPLKPNLPKKNDGLITKIPGLPANAKPSEADLNDVAGYK
jgi:hypothetical protein